MWQDLEVEIIRLFPSNRRNAGARERMETA